MDIKQQIKEYLANENTSLTSVVNMINAINPPDQQTTVQNINNKLSRGTIKYSEVLEIADVLGYDVIWKKRNPNEIINNRYNNYLQQELDRPLQTGVNYERMKTNINNEIIEQEISKFYYNVMYLLSKFKFSPMQETRNKQYLNDLLKEFSSIPLMSFIFQYSDYLCQLLNQAPSGIELINMIQRIKDIYYRIGIQNLFYTDKQGLIDSLQYFYNSYFKNLEFIEDYPKQQD
jgi:hypothetical protein